MVDELTLGHVLSEYLGFPCQFSFYQLLHTHLSSGAGTIGQIVADVPSGLSLTPPQEIKNLKKIASCLHLFFFFFFLYGAAAHVGPWPPLYEVP
jgi:hypothetical protein